ncbi:hypothetical protein [Okeania sp. SIO1I7]|uniref:hypothetical protein n=1 Tax=Okeania sp. SIO1I7 TaxID=2607772 RepID=UPI0013F81D26|nr:hypothetical protein [Okeania sp. SIO1I7]NET27987.1 hypothetical protein [Okeania sp. SIO1I7]
MVVYAAFCDCQIHPENNELNKRKDGLVSLLGTRRGFRKQGLGRGIFLSVNTQIAYIKEV